MPKVRVSLFEEPIEVDDDEVEVLRAQGLLKEEVAAEPTPRPAATKATAKKDGES